MLDAIPPHAKHGGGPFFAGSKPIPVAEIARLNIGRSERIASLKVAKLEREADAVSLSNPAGSNALSADLKESIQDVAEQLAVQYLVTPDPGQPPAPVPRAWRYLQAIDSLRSRLNAGQLAEAARDLHKAIEASAHPAPDKKLLLEVIDEITRADAIPLNRFMADKLFSGLCLGQFKLKEDGEEEPNSRAYNSMQPNLALSTLEYGALGRTMLWEGACHLCSGPRQAARRDKLRNAIFAFAKEEPVDFSDPMNDPLDEHEVYEL